MKEKFEVLLRRAVSDDLEFLFQLRNEPSVRESSFNPKEITLKAHSDWYIQKLNDLNTHFFVILANGEKVGQIRVVIEGGCGVISIATVKEHRGRGYGRRAIQDTCKLIFSEDPRIEEMIAYIKLDNTTSLKVFSKAGFSQEDVIKIEGLSCHKMILRKREYLLIGPDYMGYVPPFPKVLRIEPASACNFKCIHCPTGLDMNPNVGIMGMDVFDRIFERIKMYHFRVIVMYHGGESFLNKNFFEMAKKLRSLADRIELNSNGSTLSDKLIKQILNADLIDRISFSIDGNSPEENNRIRIGANFRRITLNIKKLIAARNELGLERPRIYIANAQFPETLAQVGNIAVPQFLSDTFKEVESDISYKCTYALIWAGMDIKPGSTQPDNNYCDHIINTFTIRANGDVVPCCYDLTTEMLMGNVLKQSPEEIWRNKKYVGLRKSIASFNPPKLCQGCEVLYPKAYMTRMDVKIT